MSIKLKNILYTILEQDEYSKAADDIASSAVETKNEPLNVHDAIAEEPPRSEKSLVTMALGYYLDSNKSTLTELFGKKGSKEIAINNIISKFIGGLNGDEKKRFEDIGGITKIKQGFSDLDNGKTEITTSEDNVFILNKTSDSRFTVKLSSKDKEYKPIDPLGDFIKQAGGEDGDSGLSKIIGTNENLRDITIDPDTNFKVDLKHLLQKHIVDDSEDIEEIDAVYENEEYCPKCMAELKSKLSECWKSYKQVGMKKKGNKMVPNCVPRNEEIEEAKKKGKCKPTKGKRFAKRVDGKCRSFGQKGKAKGGGDRIRPGTKKGNAYCARSAKIKKCKNPPCANALSRKKWKCQGSRSVA